jgi:hypothetical protein
MAAIQGAGMSIGQGVDTTNARRLVIERVAASHYINRSARLRDLLLYLADRVLEQNAGEIHEQEVGHHVFGRPADYDTTSDNIVRVHASMLRKRLEQYFAAEGSEEPLILEIPKGNYAPVFHERPERPEPVEAAAIQAPAPAQTPAPAARPALDRRWWALVGLTGALACSTAYLLATRPAGVATPESVPPTVRLFWSQMFRPGRATDVVLDDASIALYQELTGKTLTSSEYSDKSYLRTLGATAAASNLNEQVVSLFKRRNSSFADTNILWKLLQMPGAGGHSLLRFARDYSFRELRADDAVLLGNSRSNLWVEAFQQKIGLRWSYDAANGYYYPVDTWDGGKSYHSDISGDTHEGYCGIAFLPNLGGTGTVLIVSGTGGSSINGGADFLADESALALLRQKLGGSKEKPFPYFEALIRVEGRSASPRNSTIMLCRPPKG